MVAVAAIIGCSGTEWVVNHIQVYEITKWLFDGFDSLLDRRDSLLVNGVLPEDPPTEFLCDRYEGTGNTTSCADCITF
jgi:hypothetical protein